jgi:hypothetical protein
MTADNLLLWAHYASDHRGLAIELNPHDQEFNRHTSRDRNFERAGEVRYSAERPRIPETDEILFDHFFVKSLEWSYEQEAYRHLVVDAADQRIGLRQSQAEQSSPAILTNELPDAEGYLALRYFRPLGKTKVLFFPGTATALAASFANLS